MLNLRLKRMRSDSDGGSKNLKIKPLNSMRNSFHATILLLCTLAFIPFWGTLHSIISEKIFGEFVSIPEEVYNFWSFPVVLLLTLLTGYCMLQGVVKPKGLPLIMLVAILIAAVTSFLPGTPTLLSPASEFYQQSTFLVQLIGSVPVISYVSIALFMAGGIIFRFFRSKRRFSQSNIGIALIHAGFIFIVLGAIVSTSFSRVDTLDYTLKELSTPQNIDSTWSVLIIDSNIVNNRDEREQVLNLNFYKNGDLHGSGTVSLTKSDRFGYFHKILIHRTIFTDILIHSASDALNLSLVQLSVKVIPLVNILWGGGVILILIGIIILE